MNILDAVSRFFRGLERDRIDAKFDHFDERMDNLERSNSAIQSKIESMNEINFANNEALEQKLNASKASHQQIIAIMDLRFSYAEDALKEIKSLIMRVNQAN